MCGENNIKIPGIYLKLMKHCVSALLKQIIVTFYER